MYVSNKEMCIKQNESSFYYENDFAQKKNEQKEWIGIQNLFWNNKIVKKKKTFARFYKINA